MPALLRQPRLTWFAVGGSTFLLLPWLLAAAGRGLPLALNRGLVLLALGALAVASGGALRRLGRGDGRVLVGLLALSFFVHFVALGHEIGGLYFADEGTFLAQAQRINEGQVFKAWFIYPHLLFYLDAVVLWVAGLFQGPVEAVARGVYGLTGELAVGALITRAVTGTLGALTVVPVYLLARRLAGGLAAFTAGALIVASPIFLEVTNLNISDVPASFFATLTLFAVAKLLDGESRGLYLTAGLAAGLAAGSKYPAGVVALAIAAIWLRGRLFRWREPWGLAWAALAAILAFLVTTPSFLVFPGAATGGGTDVLFGARLYAEAGWVGVVKASNAAFYASELRHSFGLAALLLGLTGLAVLGRERFRRLAWLLPFPVAYLALLLLMKIALRRNLMPILPFLTVVAGVGIAALAERLRRRAFVVLLVAVALASPVVRSGGQLLAAASATTRDLAAAWVRTHISPGAYFIQEQYTPNLAPPPRFFKREPRFAIRVPREEMEAPEVDFLLVASEAYGRFLRPDRAGDPEIAAPAERYRELLARYPLVESWEPSRWRSGPEVRLYRVEPAAPAYLTEARFEARGLWLSDDAMRPRPEGPVTFTAEGQWALAKVWLEAGHYRIEVPGASGGQLRARNRENHTLAHAKLDAAGGAKIALRRREKVFLYVELAVGGVVSELRVVMLGG